MKVGDRVVCGGKAATICYIPVGKSTTWGIKYDHLIYDHRVHYHLAQVYMLTLICKPNDILKGML